MHQKIYIKISKKYHILLKIMNDCLAKVSDSLVRFYQQLLIKIANYIVKTFKLICDNL